MRATKFEFEQRFWIIALIFGLGFAASAIDHTWLAGRLATWVTPAADRTGADRQIAIGAVLGVGALLVFSAAMLRTWAAAYLRSAVVHASGVHADRLVADGPYRHVRNPLYLANLPFAAGVGFLASRLGWCVIVAGMWFFIFRLILREEDELRRVQGQPYAAYVAAVPRLWFSVTPRVPSSGARPQWGQAFAGEAFTWLAGTAVLFRALSRNGGLMGVMLTIGFVAYLVIGRRMKRRSTQRAATEPQSSESNRIH